MKFVFNLKVHLKQGISIGNPSWKKGVVIARFSVAISISEFQPIIEILTVEEFTLSIA
jgi:hypothetical protein